MLYEVITKTQAPFYYFLVHQHANSYQADKHENSDVKFVKSVHYPFLYICSFCLLPHFRTRVITSYSIHYTKLYDRRRKAYEKGHE